MILLKKIIITELYLVTMIMKRFLKILITMIIIIIVATLLIDVVTGIYVIPSPCLFIALIIGLVALARILQKERLNDLRRRL